jgi:hypothetical protein
VTSDAGRSTDTWTDPVPLSVKEQKDLVRSLLRGLSPTMACFSIGVSLESARLTLATDARFRRKCDQVPEALSENVRASLYSNALKGTVAAQALWFKEEAARKVSGQEQVPMNVDELLAELERLSRMLRSLGTDSK